MQEIDDKKMFEISGCIKNINIYTRVDTTVMEENKNKLSRFKIIIF